VASLWGSVGAGTKEDESRTWRVWAAGFRNVTARSRLVRVLKLMNRSFL
jgi:head-tail adaptor